VSLPRNWKVSDAVQLLPLARRNVVRPGIVIVELAVRSPEAEMGREMTKEGEQMKDEGKPGKGRASARVLSRSMRDGEEGMHRMIWFL
jgi:hypothetical protein